MTNTAVKSGTHTQSSRYFIEEDAMKTKEFFQNLSSLEDDNIHPEFHVYTAVWMKSRMPEAYKELKSSFKNIEGEIMAQYACDDADTELPF